MLANFLRRDIHSESDIALWDFGLEDVAFKIHVFIQQQVKSPEGGEEHR